MIPLLLELVAFELPILQGFWDAFFEKNRRLGSTNKKPFTSDNITSNGSTSINRPNGASNLLPERARCMSLAVGRSDEFHAVHLYARPFRLP